MLLQGDEVRDLLDELAQTIEETLGKDQAITGQDMLVRLEALRKLIETATPDLIGAYYGYLQVKEQFLQISARISWAKDHFWRLFWWQVSILTLLLAVGVGYDWMALVRHFPTFPTVFGVPLASVWWGALGATLAALHTLYHSRLTGTLSQSMEAWFAAKQLIGGVLGLVASLLLQVGVVTMGNNLAEGGLLPYLLAFFAGFSERRFLTYLQGKMGNLLQPSKNS